MAEPGRYCVGPDWTQIGDRAQDIQIWVGQMAPVIIPNAGPPAGVVGLFQFSTVGWAPIDQTVRSVQM